MINLFIVPKNGQRYHNDLRYDIEQEFTYGIYAKLNSLKIEREHAISYLSSGPLHSILDSVLQTMRFIKNSQTIMLRFELVENLDEIFVHFSDVLINRHKCWQRLSSNICESQYLKDKHYIYRTCAFPNLSTMISALYDIAIPLPLLQFSGSERKIFEACVKLISEGFLGDIG